MIKILLLKDNTIFALCKGFICLIEKNLLLQITFPIKLYQPEEDPTKGQILDKGADKEP